MKKSRVLFIPLIAIALLVLVGCDDGGGGGGYLYKLAGTVNSSAVNASFKTDGSERASADAQDVEGVLVYGDLTINASGTFEAESGNFVLSSEGTINSIKLVFAIEGTVEDGDVTESRIILTIYENSKITGTYTASLSETDDSPDETDSVLTRTDTTSYGFTGSWYYTAGGYTDRILFTPTSYTFIPGNSSGTMENGVIVSIREITAGSEWALLAAVDVNMLSDIPGSSGEAYEVHVLKVKLENGQLKAGELHSDTVIYVLTDRDLPTDNTGATAFASNERKVVKVTFDNSNHDNVTAVALYDFSSESFGGFSYDITLSD